LEEKALLMSYDTNFSRIGKPARETQRVYRKEEWKYTEKLVKETKKKSICRRKALITTRTRKEYEHISIGNSVYAI
jgi:hypothetical protein